MLNLDTIVQALNAGRQRATYGAIAGILGSPAQALMSGRERNPLNSWVVNQDSGLPTGYEPMHVHADLLQESTVLSTAAELNDWLATHGAQSHTK